MDIRDLLAQLQELRQSNNQEQKSMDEASMENSEATINPSMFTARKQQELKGIPKEDIRDVISQTEDYMDPRIADMSTMSGNIKKLQTMVPSKMDSLVNFIKNKEAKVMDAFEAGLPKEQIKGSDAMSDIYSSAKNQLIDEKGFRQGIKESTQDYFKKPKYESSTDPLVIEEVLRRSKLRGQ